MADAAPTRPGMIDRLGDWIAKLFGRHGSVPHVPGPAAPGVGRPPAGQVSETPAHGIALGGTSAPAGTPKPRGTTAPV